MPLHVLKKLLCHGGVGFYTGMEGRVTDNSGPEAVNPGQAVRSDNAALGAVALVGFPCTDNRLRLDVHAIDTGNRGLLCCLPGLNPCSNDTRTTGKIEQPVCLHGLFCQSFQQHACSLVEVIMTKYPG